MFVGVFVGAFPGWRARNPAHLCPSLDKTPARQKVKSQYIICSEEDVLCLTLSRHQSFSILVDTSDRLSGCMSHVFVPVPAIFQIRTTGAGGV